MSQEEQPTLSHGRFSLTLRGKGVKQFICHCQGFTGKVESGIKDGGSGMGENIMRNPKLTLTYQTED